MADAKIVPPGLGRKCRGCDKWIATRKFCTNDCRRGWYSRTSKERDEARRRAAGIKPPQPPAAAVCPECLRTFSAKRNSRLHAHCSRWCAYAPRRRQGAVGREAALYARWSNTNKDLEQSRLRPVRVALLSSIVKFVINPRQPCLDCGTWVGRTDRRTERCARCAYHRSRLLAKPSRRAAKAKRRAIERGVQAETFDPFEIFNRDGWRCHLCGVRTPKRLRGSYDSRAPELDHIVPIALGGKHTRTNTACACRRCNIAKGARALGQLRLAA